MKLALWSYQAPAHVGVSKAAASFAKLHCVVRAPKGDGYSTIMLAMFERLGVLPPLSFCAMSEATLAGAAADLPAMLREIDAREKPEMIVVTRSATAAVLQEPLDGEVAMMRPGEVNAEIFMATTHPVRDTELTAFAKTTREIVAHFAVDTPRTERPSVNIIGPSLLGFHDRANVEALRKSFDILGIEINAVLPLGATPDDLRTIGRAWVNVPTAHELAKPTLDFLRDRFGTPYVDALPYGEAGTTRFLRELCALCEIPAERIAAASRDAKLLWYSRTVDAHALSSKRVAVFGLPTAAAGIARVLRDELDMDVEFVGTYVIEYGDWLRERVRDITENVIVTDDYREVARAIDRTRPDIMFGSQMERHSASGFGVPCAVVSPPSHILNYPLGYAPLHRVRRREPHRRPREPDAGPRPRASPDRDVRTARSGALRRSGTGAGRRPRCRAGSGRRRRHRVGRRPLGCGGGTSARTRPLLRPEESARERREIRARTIDRRHRRSGHAARAGARRWLDRSSKTRRVRPWRRSANSAR